MIDLCNRYRPSNFTELVGQDDIIKSIKEIIDKDKKLPSVLLLTGSSGVGKTSLARICAKAINCLDSNLIELNGAQYTGVENVRQISDIISYRPFGSQVRVIIFDEVHRLSVQAWDALLKVLEEPPVGLSWILCSTSPHKIPTTVKTRCHTYDLAKVSPANILGLLTKINEAEKFSLDKKILSFLAVKSDGSARQAIVYLSMARSCINIDQVKDLIKDYSPNETPAIIELCRALLFFKSYKEIVTILNSIEEDNESIRLAILGYFTKVVLNPDTEQDKLTKAFNVIQQFSGTSFHPSEKLAPIVLRIATIIL